MKTVRPCLATTTTTVVLFFSVFGSSTANNDGRTGNRSAPGMEKIRKCCEANRAYDPATRYCRKTSQNVNEIFPRLLARSVNGMTIPYDHKWLYCHNDVLANVPTDEVQGLLDNAIGTNAQELPKDHCFDVKWSAGGENDDGQLVARKCKPYADYCVGNVTCVKKCCKRENKMIVESSCIATETPFQYPIYEIGSNKNGNVSFTRSNNTLVTYYQTPVCVNFKVDNDFKLASNGSLYLIDTRTYLPQSEFCMENYQPTARDPELSAFVCKIEYTVQQEYLNDENHSSWKYIALMAGFILSVLCLLLTLLVYIILPTLQKQHDHYVMCYVACFFVSVMCLMVIEWLKDTISNKMCIFFGYATLYGCLATFCWLSVLCFDVYWTIGRQNYSINRSGKLQFRTRVYHIYCWGFSSIFVKTAIIFQFSDNIFLVKLSPKIGLVSCWFEKSEYGFSIFYIFPVTITLVFNIICFVLTAKHCARIKSDLNIFNENCYKNERFQADKEKIAVNMKLFLVMGIPWIFEMLNKEFPKTWIISIIFDQVTVLQGVMIFYILVLKKKVISDLRYKFRCFINQTEILNDS